MGVPRVSGPRRNRVGDTYISLIYTSRFGKQENLPALRLIPSPRSPVSVSIECGRVRAIPKRRRADRKARRPDWTSARTEAPERPFPSGNGSRERGRRVERDSELGVEGFPGAEPSASSPLRGRQVADRCGMDLVQDASPVRHLPSLGDTRLKTALEAGLILLALATGVSAGWQFDPDTVVWDLLPR